MITMIVARANNGIIGSKNSLPWNLVGELKYFQKMTIGKTVVMGRNTFESIGSKPLPNRTNVVLSRDRQFVAPKCVTIHDINSVNVLDENFIVIGGEQIYRHFMPIADRLIVTHVDLEVYGDAVFPTINPKDWKEVETTDAVYFCKIHKYDVQCRHVVYERISSTINKTPT